MRRRWARVGCLAVVAFAAYCILDLAFGGPLNGLIRATILVTMSLLVSI